MLNNALLNKENGKDEYELLINVANTMEADLIISKLEVNDIPSFKSYKSSGSYLNITSGFNFQGTDIFVPKVLVDKAKLIISEVEPESTNDEITENNKTFEELKNKYSTKRRSIFRLIVFILIIIPLLFALFYGFQELFSIMP